MKLLINTSTLSGTGVTQVAVSFIMECIKIPHNEYHVFLSPSVAKQLDQTKFPSNFFFYLIESHPIYGMKGFFTRRRIKKLCQKIAPDCVFSVFGPSCWSPSVPHLQGYAYPYCIYPESPIFTLLTLKEKILIAIHKKIYCYFLKRNGKYFVCETSSVSNRLHLLLNIPKANVFTVTNTCNTVFQSSLSNKRVLPLNTDDEFRFLSLCSFMKHKNLEILNRVIPLLQKRSLRKIRFVLTVDEVLFTQKISDEVKECIINVGKVDIVTCPYLYRETDALFLPTLLECFSANYPEAMMMERPILTSNLSFATEVCGDAALYFNPMDPNDICEKILMVVNSVSLRQKLIENGRKQLTLFDSSFERAQKYIDCCTKIIQHEKLDNFQTIIT